MGEHNDTTWWPLVAAHVEECNGMKFNVMQFVYLETELPETPPLFFGHSVYKISSN
jgi:hypothetical protein